MLCGEGGGGGGSFFLTILPNKVSQFMKEERNAEQSMKCLFRLLFFFFFSISSTLEHLRNRLNMYSTCLFEKIAGLYVYFCLLSTEISSSFFLVTVEICGKTTIFNCAAANRKVSSYQSERRKLGIVFYAFICHAASTPTGVCAYSRGECHTR